MIWTEPYQPRLVDVQHLADREGETYFNQFGIDKAVVPASMTALTAAWDEVVDRFNTKYRFRRIGQETMEQWQELIQSLIFEYGNEADRGIRIYAANDTPDEIVGYTETLEGSNQAGGKDKVTDSSSSKSRHADTPYSTINANGSYGDSEDAAEGTGTSATEYGRSDTRSYTLTRTDHARMTEDIRRAIDGYEDVLTTFVRRFEVCFLQVFD